MTRWWLAGAAAAAAIVLFVWSPWAGQLTTFHSHMAMEMGHALPDGSMAYLNGGSKIEFSADDWSEDRFINLTGEAYFDVENGSSFAVNTNEGVVTVLGTTFNVFNRGKNFEVECYTGKVNVEHGSASAVLTPGQAVSLKDGELVVFSVDRSNPDWKLGEYKFENAPAKEVFDELQWQLGMQISTPDLTGYSFTGEFSTTDAELALSTVCLALGLTHTINDDMSVTVAR